MSVVVFPSGGSPRGVQLCIGDLAAASSKKGGAEEAKAEVDFGEVMSKAAKKAFRGGVAGMAAGVVQVMSFMWMRTTMNYQYAQGGNMRSALKSLYLEGSAGKKGAAAVAGGIGRFYRGLPYAIVQAPISRFGDTAANTGESSSCPGAGAAGALSSRIYTC